MWGGPSSITRTQHPHLYLSVRDRLVVVQAATVMASGVDLCRTLDVIYTFSGEGPGVCPTALGGVCVGLANPAGLPEQLQRTGRMIHWYRKIHPHSLRV